MLLSRDLKKTKEKKPEPYAMIDTSKSQKEIDAIRKKQHPEPPGYTKTPPLKKPLTLQDAEKRPDEGEKGPLRSNLSNELDEVNGKVKGEYPQKTPIEPEPEAPPEDEPPEPPEAEEPETGADGVLKTPTPWLTTEGEFTKLPLADYRSLSSDQKKAYSEAKKGA